MDGQIMHRVGCKKGIHLIVDRNKANVVKRKDHENQLSRVLIVSGKTGQILDDNAVNDLVFVVSL